MPVAVFLLVRLLLLVALPLDGLRGYGDFTHFYQMAALPGLPYLQYWSEFPPVFPYLSKIIYLLAGGKEHVFTYLVVFLLIAADCGNLLLFIRIQKLVPSVISERRTWIYTAILAGLPYGWWYFDSLSVFFLLLGIYFSLAKQPAWRVGLTLGFGGLVKLFPLIALPAVATRGNRRMNIIVVTTALAFVIGVYGVFFAASPDFTQASLSSQSTKGSWETIWALVDGNYQTGNFSGELERLDPSTAKVLRGNPSVIPSWVLIGVFGILGLCFWWRYPPKTAEDLLAFTGLTATLFFYSAVGWSPQWVLYLIPLILLTLQEGEAQQLVVLLVLVNLCEWPLLLSRGLWWGLWLTIPLRMFLMGLAGWRWAQSLMHPLSECHK